MATRSMIRTMSRRETHWQSDAYLHRTIKFTDALGANTDGKFFLGVLPANAQPIETVVRINSSFDKTAQLMVGSTLAASSAAYATTLDIDSATTGLSFIDRCAGVAYSSVDVALYIKMGGFGTTVPTVGEADVWVRYLPAN